MDVYNTFLHRDLAEEVYMRIPPGFEKGRAGQGVRLNVLVYVDDIIISGNDTKQLQRFKQYLSTCFKLNYLGKLKYFLGIEIARSTEGLFLCQIKYALDIISEAGLLGEKPATLFPMEQNPGHPFSSLPTTRRYFPPSTRPGLLEAPSLLRRDCDLMLSGWSDSDRATCPQTRRSVTGRIVYLDSSPLSWKSKKHDTVSLSSAVLKRRIELADIFIKSLGRQQLEFLLVKLGIHNLHTPI
ncbi:hypothetical protein LIER_03984 [Lithospermum erythrorhizon]|uniref:Reverse transcriptase Ty1/copia-type domain-containing protein n=1 Tax=Lithospermum erythrorhizon TaxID=34254 RepID=A0AAV3NWA6_LITER